MPNNALPAASGPSPQPGCRASSGAGETLGEDADCRSSTAGVDAWDSCASSSAVHRVQLTLRSDGFAKTLSMSYGAAFVMAMLVRNAKLMMEVAGFLAW